MFYSDYPPIKSGVKVVKSKHSMWVLAILYNCFMLWKPENVLTSCNLGRWVEFGVKSNRKDCITGHSRFHSFL